MSDSYRVAVVGATGAVGTTMLSILRERDFPASEVVPFASERSAGRELDGATEPVRALATAPTSGLRRGHVLGRRAPRSSGRRGSPPPARSSSTTRRAWRMDPDVPLVVAEVNPDAVGDHPKGIVANPNCTTTRWSWRSRRSTTRRARARDPVHLPVGVGNGNGRDRRAARPGARHRCTGRTPPRPRSTPPHRLQRDPPGRDVQGRRRPHDRGAQGDRETRKVLGAARPAHHRDMRTRPGRHRALGIGERRDARRLSPERAREILAAAPGVEVRDDPAAGVYPMASRRRVGTTSSSAASAATRATSARSTSGSSATTCARARRSTRCRSPSSCTRAG